MIETFTIFGGSIWAEIKRIGTQIIMEWGEAKCEVINGKVDKNAQNRING